MFVWPSSLPLMQPELKRELPVTANRLPLARMPLISSSNLIRRLVVFSAAIVGWYWGVAALAEPPIPPVPGQPVQQVSQERPAPASHETAVPTSRESAVSSREQAGPTQFDQAVSPSAASLPLRPSSGGLNTGDGSQGTRAAADGRSKELSPVTSLTTALSGLAIVLGLFFLASWLLKRAMPKSARTLPGEVFDVLGRASLAARQPVHLIRIGRKLILVSVSADGVKTLTEITDPAEVDRLAGICAQQSTESSSSAFANVFQQFQSESAATEFLGSDDRSTAETADGRPAQEGRNV